MIEELDATLRERRQLLVRLEAPNEVLVVGDGGLLLVVGGLRLLAVLLADTLEALCGEIERKRKREAPKESVASANDNALSARFLSFWCFNDALRRTHFLSF